MRTGLILSSLQCIVLHVRQVGMEEVENIKAQCLCQGVKDGAERNFPITILMSNLLLIGVKIGC